MNAGEYSLYSVHMHPRQQETSCKVCYYFWICYIIQTKVAKKKWVVYLVFILGIYEFN